MPVFYEREGCLCSMSVRVPVFYEREGCLCSVSMRGACVL